MAGQNQPTGSGQWIWKTPLEEVVWEFGTLPDPSDERIAALESAILLLAGRAIPGNGEVHIPVEVWQRVMRVLLQQEAK